MRAREHPIRPDEKKISGLATRSLFRIDYEVYAQYNGHKSDTKTVSQFETVSNSNINLKIDTK